ncbi:hypothetical protein ACERII_05130 [Evansella sp. AB-rgal1]|uniref:hypothetical protein n=1 Tax=Evansella sp. AB-rgal1 TaxID=3242696 RepID=UPI00359E45FF
MMKTYILLFLSILFLAGCKAVNDGPIEKISDFTLEKEVTQIDVLDWETEETIYQITDTDFIQELVIEFI